MCVTVCSLCCVQGLTVAVKTVLFSEREDGDTKLPHERAIMEAAVCTSVQVRARVAAAPQQIGGVMGVAASVVCWCGLGGTVMAMAWSPYS